MLHLTCPEKASLVVSFSQPHVTFQLLSRVLAVSHQRGVLGSGETLTQSTQVSPAPCVVLNCKVLLARCLLVIYLKRATLGKVTQSHAALSWAALLTCV